MIGRYTLRKIFFVKTYFFLRLVSYHAQLMIQNNGNFLVREKFSQVLTGSCWRFYPKINRQESALCTLDVYIVDACL